MRILAVALLAALATSVWSVPQPMAADLAGPASAYACEYRAPGHYGAYDPWSRREERTPRKGVWYYTQNPAPTVNFLIPMHGRLCLRPTPWTPAWYEYCSRRWPSFNRNTGTIETPDGRRMCM
ncbi:hypothetical protein RDV64_05675 [Acuticoccus sp. MNP-M23]|uniref:hypothetical protein n=1 Tax=Acuticoccus sp. MNP-M23 TaxID=3072793 RepID=UPI002814DD6F|nr:hypothetical protein [Acuticoccus sp. MNP-M23]WMS43882.1 hypothetical protein RDV64_05675 [Acuticoccus sp. MNP-M23]